MNFWSLLHFILNLRSKVRGDSSNCAFQSVKSIYNKGTARTVFAMEISEIYCLESFVFPLVSLKSRIHSELDMLTSI